MDLAELKCEFGRHLSLQGGVDIQETLPYGTPEDVRAEVHERMEAGKKGGGYIICTAHNILPEVPEENVVALLDAYHEYGKY